MPDEPGAKAKKLGLPPRIFLYTLDQISVILSVPVKTIERSYIYYENRSIGHKRRIEISAQNIAPPEEPPEWRVTEREFINWLKRMGFLYYERGYLE